MTQPFSVRIFLVDGDPAGIKVVEKSNWTGAKGVMLFLRKGHKWILS